MLKNYFYHNAKERKATVILLVLILLIWGLSWAWRFMVTTNPIDFSSFESEIQAFEEDIALAELDAAAEREAAYRAKYPKWEKKNRYPSYDKEDEETETIKTVEPFPFDPNNATETELLSLGLSKRTVRSIVNYREKGGQYRTKTDFGKIYTLELADFARLEPFLQLPDTLARKQYAAKTYEPREAAVPTILDINKATAEELQKLRGIGPSFAQRIIKYRDALGGFAKLAQLGEVYGLPDSVFMKISPYLTCNRAQIKKLNINSATAEELKSHPYLRWRHANAIIGYRERNGPFTKVEMLRTLFEFDDAEGTYWKVKDYLTTQ
jgi:competence protein ComEA